MSFRLCPFTIETRLKRLSKICYPDCEESDIKDSALLQMYQALAPECIQAWKQGKLDWFGVDKAKALSYSIGIFIFRMAINERYIDKNNPG